jgi:hypothetical protein
MTGGLMQLVAYGAQDVYLTGNPQITFFKIVYRRHTNFSIESIEHSVIGEPRFGRRITVTFTRNADLINKIYVKIILNEVNIPVNNKFAWVRRIGHALIRQVEFELGGTILDRHYGTWLDVWYELARSGDHERGYAHMIGDIPELTTYNGITKPEYTLFVPLQFWFNRHVGLSIPLIALQYHDARIHIEFNEKEKVIVKDCNFDDTSIELKDTTLLVNYIYLDSEERRRFAQVGHEYLIEQIQFNGVEPVLSLVTTYKLDYNHPTKELIWAMKNGNYISGKRFIFYTDKDSWDECDQTDIDCLTPIEEASCKIITESISVIDDPTASVGGTWTEVFNGTVITPTTATIGTINITNKNDAPVYVNPESLKIGDYGITDKINADVTVDADGNIIVNTVKTSLTVRDFSVPHEFMTDTRVNVCDPLVNQYNNYGILIDGTVNPIQFGLLKLNGHDRFDEREGAYFNYVQPAQHHSNTPADGINVYSFALFPEQHQPSGSANLSRIDDTVLTLRFLDSTSSTNLPSLNFLNDGNELWVFATNYNILRIMSGLGGLAYSTT